LEGTGKGSQSYYYKGNIYENSNGTLACDGTNDDCGRTYQKAASQVLDWQLWVDEPFFPSFVYHFISKKMLINQFCLM
jgi:hypothetical protein